MSAFPIGRRIADPRVLSDEVGGESSMYANLASYTFGSPADARPDARPSPSPDPDPAEISPLTVVPRPSPDRTPRPSVAAPLVSSHPSQQHPECTHHPALFSPQRDLLISDTASQHTFGRPSHTPVSARDPPAPSSSASASAATSRSSSRASIRTAEQFSSDDELDFPYDDDGSPSPVTFARDLLDIDEDVTLNDPRPSSFHFSLFQARRGSLPMAIPGALQPSDAYSSRSREGSILTVRRPSRSWDDGSIHRSSRTIDDPTVILPKSEPVSRAGRISMDDQFQSKHQSVEPDALHGLDLQYILSKRSEGSIRSFGSRLSFVQSGGAAYRRSSPHLSPIPLGLGSTTTLPFEDSFTRHLQKHDRNFDAARFYWSFQREKADPSSSSARRRQLAHHHRTDKSVKEVPSRVQELWRCGHVGRFKVDRLVFKPQSADPAKAAQHRIQIRHIPDPYSIGSSIAGPHSVIHKHSRAVAFSIFRSHGLFSGGRQTGGMTGLHPNPPTHMNTRSGTMLALKKVQEQYTSTKTTKQLGPFQSGDKRSDSRDKDGKGKGKTRAAGRGRTKEKKHHRVTESAESSTATSSAGSVTHAAVQQIISAPEHPVMKIHLSPSTSSFTTVYKRDSINRPVSSASSVATSIVDSVKITDNDALSVVPARHHRDHRDSIDSEDRFPSRTTHAEAFSTLNPNDIESVLAKVRSRGNADSASTFERLFRVFRPGSKTDDHSLSGIQARSFQPPWLVTAGRDQQEETDRVLDDLNASFRDVGLLHTNPHKPQRTNPKRKAREGILEQIPDDCLYMLLPLWPGETDASGVHAETSSAASYVTVIENRHFLLVHYVPFGEASSKDRKTGKKKAKQSHSSDSGAEPDSKAFLPAFRVVARVVTYDELRLSGVRIPSEGLAVNGPEWEAINCPPTAPSLRDPEGTVVCQCDGRERGFHFLEDGLLELGLCTREDSPAEDISELEEDEREARLILTPIGRAAVEMIWLGCLAITSFGPT